MEKKRCFGSYPNKKLYAEYHDHEWGVIVKEDKALFEMLILEGAQAGLSFETILKKREAYRKVFHQFDPVKVSIMTDEELEKLCKNPDIVRNRAKIFSTRQNAIAFLNIQKEFNSFANYLWGFVDKPIINRKESFKELPTSSSLSEKISKDLKKRGMNFVGPTIIYAFLQAVGVIDDHLQWCWKACNKKP